jgi:isoquinoline 1-oxidoreductase subunit beta
MHATVEDPQRCRVMVPRGTGVLDAAAQAAGWRHDSGPDVTRGISFNTTSGAANRLYRSAPKGSRTDDRWRVARVMCAMDCRLVVKRNTFLAQIQGGISFVLTSALKSEITFRDGAAEQSYFSDYPLLTIAEMPEIVPVIVESDRPPQGAGEIMVAPLAPAISQALLHATGQRPRKMPFGEQWFRSKPACRSAMRPIWMRPCLSHLVRRQQRASVAAALAKLGQVGQSRHAWSMPSARVAV